MMAASVFFDTEFSNFAHPKLISIGCVSCDGKEFYRELSDTYQPCDCSGFVLQTVLPLLGRGDAMMLEAQVADRLKVWIESFEQEVVLMSDAPSYDWPLVEYLFGFYGWPENLRRKCGYVYFDRPEQQKRYERALIGYWALHAARQHHALVDARSLQFAARLAVRRGEA